MKDCRFANPRIDCPLLWLLMAFVFLSICTPATAEPSAKAGAAFESYRLAVEERLTLQHHSQKGFLAPAASGSKDEAQLHSGELIVEELTPAKGDEFPGAMLHHWRATAFAPGAKAADFTRLMAHFNAYPQVFSPEVLQAKVMSEQGNRFQVLMRVKQQHILTVVLDTSYDVTFARLDALHGSSISQSTRIAEIDRPGTSKERALDASEEHGFLWRQNTYWSYEERDGGLYLQIESLSLSRAIPTGLGWAVGPFVESVPRESLEFTLRSVCKALRR